MQTCTTYDDHMLLKEADHKKTIIILEHPRKLKTKEADHLTQTSKVPTQRNVTTKLQLGSENRFLQLKPQMDYVCLKFLLRIFHSYHLIMFGLNCSYTVVMRII